MAQIPPLLLRKVSGMGGTNMYNGHRTYYINYADAGFAKAQHFSAWAAKHWGRFDEIIEYGPESLDQEFCIKHKDTLEIRRGAGVWIWKPYIIMKTLESMEEGDYLFYCDAGAFLIKPCDDIFDGMKDGDIWVSDIPLIEREWTKPALFDAMGVADRDHILNSNAIQAGFVGIRKSDISTAFVKKWYKLCCNSALLWPMRSDEPHGCCIAHREDQSILSVLSKVQGIKPHRDPSQYGRIPEKYRVRGAVFSVPHHPEDTYPVMIILHRTGDLNKKIVLRQWLNVVLPKKLVYRLIK